MQTFSIIGTSEVLISRTSITFGWLSKKFGSHFLTKRLPKASFFDRLGAGMSVPALCSVGHSTFSTVNMDSSTIKFAR